MEFQVFFLFPFQFPNLFGLNSVSTYILSFNLFVKTCDWISVIFIHLRSGPGFFSGSPTNRVPAPPNRWRTRSWKKATKVVSEALKKQIKVCLARKVGLKKMQKKTMTTLEIYENHINHILHHSPFLFHLEYAILSLLYYFLSHPCFWRDVQDGTFADSVLKYLRMMRRWFMTNSCARIGDWTFGWMCFFFHPAMWQFYRYYWSCLLDSFQMMYSNEFKVKSSFPSIHEPHIPS